jgi:hypothetical protein
MDNEQEVPIEEKMSLEEAIVAKAHAADLGDRGFNIQAAEGSFTMGSDASLQRVPLLYMDPLFDPILIIFPQDNIRELNRRLRHYYKHDPYIRSIIDFHTETPISDFELRCPRVPEAQEYYNDFKDRVNLLDVVINMCREYWLLGESFTYGNWDETTDEFSDFVQFSPEEVEVHSAQVTNKRIFVLRPNLEMKKTLMSQNMADRRLTQAIATESPLYAMSVAQNKPFILDTNRLIVMQRTLASYSNRGISPVMAVMKELLFQDYLNIFRMTFIQRHSYPLKIFKLGDKEKGFIPPPKFYDDFRKLLIQSVNDPDFNLITHPFVTVETHTGHDKFLPLIPYYELVKQRIFAGLFVSDAIISGEKTPFAAGITFMRGLMNRYLTFRNNLENELKRKVFEHLARKREFYIPSEADAKHAVKTSKGRRLALPEFYWHKANLLSNQAVQQMIIQLREKGEIPLRYVAEMFGWDLEDMLRQMEIEEGTRADPMWKKLKEKAVVEGKVHGLGKKVLLGESIQDALKEMEKDKATDSSKPSAEASPEAGEGKKPKMEPEFGLRPPEIPAMAPAVPEGEGGGHRPAPSEQGGEPGPGGQA